MRIISLRNLMPYLDDWTVGQHDPVVETFIESIDDKSKELSEADVRKLYMPCLINPCQRKHLQQPLPAETPLSMTAAVREIKRNRRELRIGELGRPIRSTRHHGPQSWQLPGRAVEPRRSISQVCCSSWHTSGLTSLGVTSMHSATGFFIGVQIACSLQDKFLVVMFRRFDEGINAQSQSDYLSSPVYVFKKDIFVAYHNAELSMAAKTVRLQKLLEEFSNEFDVIGLIQLNWGQSKK